MEVCPWLPGLGLLLPQVGDERLLLAIMATIVEENYKVGAPRCVKSVVKEEVMTQAAVEVPWLSEEEDATWREYLAGVARLDQALNRRLEVAGELTLSEYEILVRLSETSSREMRMADLADSVFQTRSRLTHTVRRLEDRGVVVRRECAEDGRGVNCYLTDKGMQLIVSLAPQHVRDVRELLIDAVSPEDLAALHRVMSTVNHLAMREGSSKPARK